MRFLVLADIGYGKDELRSSVGPEPEADSFAAVFAEINDMIVKGVIEKSVPVATQRGQAHLGEMVITLLAGLQHLGAPFYSYGWSSWG